MSYKEVIQQIADPNLTPSERARLRVHLSKELEEAGKYEEAREALRELWPHVGEWPVLENLDPATRAEVLCRVGALTSCIGSEKQIEGAQETAKNLISESLAIFEELRDIAKIAEAQIHLAYCYWRQGEFDEARTLIQEALGRLPDTERETKALALVRSAIIERSAGRLIEALRIHTEAAPIFEKIGSHALKGMFHTGLAVTLKKLGETEHREDYIDRALIEYAAASYHFEQAGHERYRALIENNLGFILLTVGRFKEAHEHVNRARRIFAGLKDAGSVAQVDDTRARVLLAEGRHAEAERAARAAVRALEKGDGQALLAEALTTHGIALARTGQYARARRALERALAVAGRVGDREGAGRAALAVVELLGGQLDFGELSAAYERAVELLSGSQQPGVKERLLACSLSLLRRRAPETPGPAGFVPPRDWKGFSLAREVLRYERLIIERALKDAGGVVTRAAQLLGFKHHNSLISRINKRHTNLLKARSPVLPRKRSIIRDPDSQHQPPEQDETRAVTILHVEDDRQVADVLRDTLEDEGWRVETCPDGLTAMRRLAGDTHYDLLLFDQGLPGASGLELVRAARRLPHRRRTPIVMLSAHDCEAEAWRAGVDAFLRKPEDIRSVTTMIARLLADPDDDAEE
jgi:CheY-like chemotaxis protein/tetratricopeptide (TPR) repeat protein